MKHLLVVLLGLIALSSAEVFFSETFGGRIKNGRNSFFTEGWESRWVKSTNKEAEGTQGEWAVTAGKYSGDTGHKGLQTTEDARFYQISAALPKEFSNKGKDLVIQYTV